jgi:hypothetical protein
MPVVRAVNGNLGFFRPVWTWRNDFVDGSWQSGAWQVWNSAVSRFRSAILADLAIRGCAISFSTLARVSRNSFMPHVLILAPSQKP